MSAVVKRDNVGIFGRMNVGKSTIMNLITEQNTSIVDETPGTTADSKVALFEIHGIGPVRISDTAGADETGVLGDKKKQKVKKEIKECDLILLVVNPENEGFALESEILDDVREMGKQIIVIYNIFSEKGRAMVKEVEASSPELKLCRKIVINALEFEQRARLIEFILNNYDKRKGPPELLPFLERDNFYVLIIPMDNETPQGRYLRPQAMVEEYITRKWCYPVSFRMDLGTARSDNPEPELKRFKRFLDSLSIKPKAIITDSQAMDIMGKWCPDDIMLTTFSIVMINHTSGGKLPEFVKGIKTLDKLGKGSRVLIVEACNHSRIGEDIGIVQIPNILKRIDPEISIEHNFGREFYENPELKKYDLLIHCGGCMVSDQKMEARIRDLDAVGVPYTNYGVFLSYVNGPEVLKKVLIPWGLDSLV